MIKVWKNDRLFFLFIFLYILGIATLIFTTPLSPGEAELFYRENGSLAIWVARLFHRYFSDSFSLRLVPFFLGISNLWLFYRLLLDEFPKIEDRRFTLVLFAIMPGVIAANVLLNDAVFALTLTLLFLLAYKKKIFWLQLLALILLLSTATAMFALYLAVAIYAFLRKEYPLAILATILFFISLATGLYNMGGHPRGHLLDLFGIYATLFSPLFFVYYFYALYRVAIEGPRDLVWSISFSALILSILLSIRQHILIVDFSPYLLAGIMIPVQVYFRSMRVRMNRFQSGYKIAGSIVLATLIFSSAVVILHRPIYYMLGKPHYFFASELYEIPQKIEILRKKGILCHSPVKERYKALYRFYNMPSCKP